jgi:hypothetical protein
MVPGRGLIRGADRLRRHEGLDRVREQRCAVRTAPWLVVEFELLVLDLLVLVWLGLDLLVIGLPWRLPARGVAVSVQPVRLTRRDTLAGPLT